MASTTFVLREPNANKRTPIVLIFRHKNQRLKHPTGEKIEPAFWNPLKQRAKETRKFLEYPEFNVRLETIATRAKTLHRQFLNDNDREPSIHELKELFNENLSGKSRIDKPNLFSFIEKFIQESKNKVNDRTGKPLSTGIIYVYNQTLFLLREFEKLKHRRLDFDNLDLDFYHEFTDYLIHVKKYSNNNIGKHIKTIKTFLHEATERGYNQNFAFKSKRFKVTREDTESIYLNEKELEALYLLELSDKPSLDNARDLFMIGCWSGLRFSDFSRLTAEHIQGDVIEMQTQKTGEKVKIPLHWTVKSIIEKYNGITYDSLPRKISNAKLNEHLKEIGERLTCLHQNVSFTMTKGGTRTTALKKKFEMLTTHTARRSFATNHYIGGVPSYIIMKITGHKTEKAFLRYIKITPDENAKFLQVYWQKKGELIAD